MSAQSLSKIDNQVYFKLRKRLDQLPIGYPKTESGVEIRILKHLFTPQEAAIAIDLSYLPETADTIYMRIKKRNIVNSKTDLENILENMAKKGSIVQHITRKGIKIYSIIMLAIGMFEFQVNKLNKSFIQDFQQYLDEAFRDEVLKSDPQQLRPVPTEHSVLRDLPILPYDDIRKIVENLEEQILVANCVCKQGHDVIGKPCKVTDRREWCIIIGSAAKNFHDLGWGRYIDKNELSEILALAEKEGLVVQPSNSQKPFCICLCCGCCCEVLTSAKPLDNPAQYFSSNYYAVVNEDECIGCGICVKRCQMDAITLIEKKAHVDLTRCIGCGLCTSTCKPQAIQLKHKEHTKEPPVNPTQLYLNMFRNRVGNAKMVLMLIKRLLGKKI
ncbi:MAG: 4Fe-4S binding protein [Candidatus Lokiarchaeota archaeon]|nr:4Fe-4S binding protein [Candidatus Harpocratesius repetitus]